MNNAQVLTERLMVERPELNDYDDKPIQPGFYRKMLDNETLYFVYPNPDSKSENPFLADRIVMLGHFPNIRRALKLEPAHECEEHGYAKTCDMEPFEAGQGKIDNYIKNWEFQTKRLKQFVQQGREKLGKLETPSS